MLLIAIALFTGIAYGLLQVFYILHWRSLRATDSPAPTETRPSVTLLVIARNEAGRIKTCLESLLAQDYPADRFEILVIDDHSTDGTLEVVAAMADRRIRGIRLADYPGYRQGVATKKSAITLAVDQAQHELILMTDADTGAGRKWISTHIDHHLRKKSVFQTGPVLIGHAQSPLALMQALEYHALMVVTGGGWSSGWHALANGANMFFTREAFRHVGGYAGNFTHASGDDMFLAEKMRLAFPSGVAFVCSLHAIVRTEAAATWADLFRQRRRWAGKNRALQDRWISRTWRFVGAVHVLLVLLWVAGLTGSHALLSGMILIGLKWIADAWLLQEGLAFSGDRTSWSKFAMSQLLYTGYVLAMGLSLLVQKSEESDRPEDPR